MRQFRCDVIFEPMCFLVWRFILKPAQRAWDRASVQIRGLDAVTNFDLYDYISKDRTVINGLIIRSKVRDFSGCASNAVISTSQVLVNILSSSELVLKR